MASTALASFRSLWDLLDGDPGTRSIFTAWQCLGWPEDGIKQQWQGRCNHASTRVPVSRKSLAKTMQTCPCWQWECTSRRAMRLKDLNAMLRLKQFLNMHANEFPAPDALAEPLRAEMAWLRGVHRQVQDEDLVAARWRADFPYLERFNLRVADLHLIGEDGAPGLAAFRSAYQETASVYIRKVFDEKAFFSFPGLSPDTFLYVLDSKTLAGREPRDEADAQSRPLALCFFKKVREDEAARSRGAQQVRRVQWGRGWRRRERGTDWNPRFLRSRQPPLCQTSLFGSYRLETGGCSAGRGP